MTMISKGLFLQGITKAYDGVEAVKNISLEIKSGEFFTLLGPSGCGKTTLLRMIAGLELGEMPKRYPHQLSRGQKQRVALARALVNEPKVLLLDEPMSALDAKLRAQVQVELRRLQKKLGQTFILVTHDQDEALVVSDRIAVMKDGQIV